MALSNDFPEQKAFYDALRQLGAQRKVGKAPRGALERELEKFLVEG